MNAYLSFRNLEKVTLLWASEVNTYDLIDNKNLVLTTDAVKFIEEVLA